MIIDDFLLKDESIIGISPLLKAGNKQYSTKELSFEVMVEGGAKLTFSTGSIDLEDTHTTIAHKTLFDFKNMYDKVREKIEILFNPANTGI